MQDCIFCKIADGEIPCQKIYENEKFLAFLDIRPLTEGQTLVIPKKHDQSNFPDANPEILAEGVKIANKVAKMIQKSLSTKRVFLTIEGVDVSHLHFKLYPSHGKGPGEILKSGPTKPTTEELEKLAEQIRTA